MPIRTNGGVFNDQMLTGSLVHYVVCGADFSGAINAFGQPVPFSAAEIIFRNIEAGAYVDIMNPNEFNLSFALEADRSIWNEISLTEMIQALGPDVGQDHVDCSVCTVKEVPYIWGCADDCPTTFLELSDTPNTYAGSAGYVVTVNPGETGLIFSPASAGSNAFESITSPEQPTINAVGSDSVAFINGSNMLIVTDALLKTVTFNALGGSSTDYVPVPPGTFLSISTKYFVTASGIVTLPVATGAGLTAGQSVIVTKPVGADVFVNAGSLLDIIDTDLGTTDSIEMDAAEQCIFIFDGTSTWNLQIGSVN